MQMGDIVNACPKLLTLAVEDGKRKYTPIPGRVVYIHPKQRFYVLEFTFGTNRVRESFFFLPEMENDIYADSSSDECERRGRENRHHR